MTCDERFRMAKGDRDFVTKNEHKPDRERWVLDSWLAAGHHLVSVVIFHSGWNDLGPGSTRT